MNRELIKRIGASRKQLAESLGCSPSIRKEAEEGGCGVVGFCCSEPVAGKHIYEPSRQMHNRGNGKGGGIATTDPELAAKMDLDWGTQRLINLYTAWRKTLVGILQRLGLRSVAELRGRTDLLMHLDYTNDIR